MEPARMAIALLPLALYLLALGLVHLRGRPQVVSGPRDRLALGLAISGLVLIGPVELLLPPLLVAQMGPLVWIAIVVVFLSAWVVLAFWAPLRIVIYNVSAEELHAWLAQVCRDWDSQAQWLGNVLSLPAVPLQLLVDYTPWSRTAVIQHHGGTTDLELWFRLQERLRQSARAFPRRAAPQGVLLVSLSLLLVAAVLLAWQRDFSGAVRELVQMFGLG